MKEQHKPLLSIKSITKVYDVGDTKLDVLRGVNLTIEEGEFVAIMGPSGSGKSTLMHILGLLDRPSGGVYEIYGQNVLKFDDNSTAFLRSKIIGFVFQQYNLLNKMTACDNVALPMIYSGGTNRVERAKNLLESVGLSERIFHKPNQLSGGQQQRVAIARALVNEPKIIFADEPTGNLASAQSDEIMQILTDLNKKGISVILVTHEPDIAQWANRVITIKDGQVISDTKKTEPQKTDNKPLKIHKDCSKFSIAEFSENFFSAIRAILANKTRSILTMLGIIIGVASIISMLALGTGAQKSLEKQIKSMGTNLLYLMPGRISMGGVAGNVVRRITLEDVDALASNTELVKNIDPTVSGNVQVVYGNKNANTSLTGATTAYQYMQNAVPEYGRFFTNTENNNSAKVCVIGATVVKNLFGDQEPVGKYIKINRKQFRVIGILPVKGAQGHRDGDDIIIVPLNTAMKRLLGTRYVSSVSVEVQEGKINETEKYLLATMLERNKLGADRADSFRIRNMSDMIQMLSSTTKTMTMLLGSVAGISLIVGGIGIMNIMLVSVSERTREIGLRKAIGATKTAVLLQFLIESSALSVLGGFFGVSLGVLISFAVSKFAGWAAFVSGFSVFLSVSFSVCVGIVFGLWPAKKASELSPIEALRSE
ncbi:MAG: ABC transporter permease [Endomicrobiaceae bacterium]|jgi:macrolide transport system ATP-binding/permease protein|nr:ABC transporter permease [Endomicrobiaceae bacterium]MDD3730053.1 ABC transporter permease [Endomicrobiaceae bacterium]